MNIPPVYFAVLTAVLVLGNLAESHPKYKLKKEGCFRLYPDTVTVIILSAFLISVSGLRYYVGTDFGVYYHKRVMDLHKLWNSLIKFDEPGIQFLSFIARSIYDDGQSLIFISAFITIGLYCWTIYRYHSMYLVSMLLFLFQGDWQGSFNGIRQYLASAILFAGHHFILEKKLWHYSLIVLIASLFHTTALVMIVPYFLFDRKPDLTQLFLLTIGAVIIRFSYGLLFNLIGSYKGSVMNLASNSYLTNDVNIFRILVAFIPVIIYIFLCRKENHTKDQDFYINALFFNAFSIMASMGSTYLARIGIYTGATLSIGYGYLFQTIKEDRTRKVTTSILLLVYFFYWIYSLGVGGLSNFRWVFQR